MEMEGPSGAFEEMVDLKYMHASHVNVSNFVSVKLSGKSNYRIWKTQMLCLVRSLGLEYLLQNVFFESYRFDGLVKGWIFGSVNEDVLLRVIAYEYVCDVWKRLEDLYGHNYQGGPSGALNIYQEMGDFRYMHASNANVSNFVSVKLSDKGNYLIWKTQMLCLVRSMGLDYILQDAFYESYHFDGLVKGWIFGSVNDDILLSVIEYKWACEVWKRLEVVYSDEDRVDNEDVNNLIKPEIRREVENETENQKMDNTRRKKLYNVVVEGCWLEAKVILENDNEAKIERIAENGDTILHLAVALGQNKFLEKLLNIIDGDCIGIKNFKGQTSLHVAVIFNNSYAFQLLLEKNENLLFLRDEDDQTASYLAFSYGNIDMILVALKRRKLEDLLTYDKMSPKFIVDFVDKAIFTKHYDLARMLVNIFPNSVTMDDHVLMTIATTFPSDLDIGEAFLYPSLKNKGRKIVERSYLLFDSFGFLYAKAEDVLWATQSLKNNIYSRLLPEIVMILLVPIVVLYPIYQLIHLLILVLIFPFSVFYFLLWKVLAILVVPIKDIEKKKKEYKEAKELLNMISMNIGKMGTYPDDHPGYSRPLLEAARQGAFDVVDEILFRSPGLIKSVTTERHNIIHLAIINRSEKIYNLVYHMVLPTGSYGKLEDSFKNNLLHLAGRLAPLHVLASTTGAALQLQRELQWYEEVKKLMLPRDLMKENNNKETPKMVFTREHGDLMKEGEKWMKTTAESCSITAALIVTIVFAAAIAVPGGSNQETGIPLFKKEIGFTIFAVSDAISLFASATSLLGFLSILTTRFSEEDFLVCLPRRMLIGLCALFLSTTSMTVAFGSVLFLVFCDQRSWMLAPIGVLACCPIATIVTLQFPLVVDLFRSTYFPIFGKRSYIERGKLIPTNPKIEFS